MKHPLQQKLQKLRQRVRGLLAVHGASRVVATVLTAIVVVCFADWASHRMRLRFFDDSGVRLIFSIVILGLLGWTAWRFLLRPFTVRLRDLDLSLRVEDRYPELEDSLASTVQFLEQADDDPAAGSAALRRAVINQSAAQLEKLDVDDVVQSRQTRRAALAAAAVCLATLGIVLLNPAGAAIALARLANPFADNPWPKQTHLEVVAYPKRVAQGEPFEVVVAVEKGSTLPSHGEIDYRTRQRGEFHEQMRRDRNVLKAVRDVVQEPFQFRVRAGDDETDWQPVEVVPPPRVEKLQLRLTFPDYTGKAPEELPEGVGQVRALRGTKVAVVASANKPLSEAGLRFTGDESVVASLDPAGQQIAAEFLVRANSAYWIHLVDREPEAFTNARHAARFDIRSVEDLAPDVFFERPTSHLQVKSDANLPLRVVAKDDLGLATISFHFSRSDQTGQKPVVVPLYGDADRPLRQAVDHNWDLAPLQLSHGTVLTLQAEASDYDNLQGPNVGKSHEIRVEIVSTDVVMERIDLAQAKLRQEIQELLKSEELSNRQVKDLQIQIDQTGRLEKPDIDNLQGAETAQRRVRQGLTSPADGVRGMIDRILEDLATNRIDAPETAERLQGMAETIERLERSPLPETELQLNAARKAALNALAENGSKNENTNAARQPEQPAEAPQRPSPTQPEQEQAHPERKSAPEPSGSETKQQQQNEPAQLPADDSESSSPAATLANAQRGQQVVIEAMQGMLDQLSQWESYREAARDVNELIQEQQQAQKDNADLAKKTLAKKVQELDPQDMADLQRAAEKQRNMAERVEQLTRRMDEFAKQMAQRDPQVAENFADAVQEAKDAAISAAMQRADRDLQNNRVGQAAQAQQQSLEGLRNVQDTLQNRREKELAKLVRRLKEAEKELRELRKQQSEHLERTNQAAQEQDQAKRREALQRLAERQAELQRQAEQFGRKLRRLQARNAGQSAQQAAGSMGQAQQGMQQGQAEQAQQQEQQALDQLEDAQRQLAQTRRQAEEQLAMEQLARIGDKLEEMLQKQNGLIERTKQLDQARAERGTFTRLQRITLRRESETQALLKQETDELIERLTAAPVFSLALRGAARNMDRAAVRLGRFEADLPTQQAQQNAAQRMKQLIDALKPESGNREGAGQQNGGGGGGSGSRQSGDGVPPMAQLKMLKSLQIEINQRTKELSELRTQTDQLTPEQEVEFQALSEEQGRLAEIVADLIRPADQLQEEEE